MTSPHDLSRICRPLEEVKYWQERKQEKEEDYLSTNNINDENRGRNQRFTDCAICRIYAEFQIIITPLGYIDQYRNTGREGAGDGQPNTTLRKENPTTQHHHIGNATNGLHNRDFTFLEENFGDGSCLETALYNIFQIMDNSDGRFVYSMAVSFLLFDRA